MTSDEQLINTIHPDPDQNAAPAGGVCLWSPDYAVYDILEPVPGEVTETGKPRLRRIGSYVYSHGRRLPVREQNR